MAKKYESREFEQKTREQKFGALEFSPYISPASVKFVRLYCFERLSGDQTIAKFQRLPFSIIELQKTNIPCSSGESKNSAANFTNPTKFAKASEHNSFKALKFPILTSKLELKIN